MEITNRLKAWIKNCGASADEAETEEYIDCIYDLLHNEALRSMLRFRQHGDVSCLEHSFYVSYNSYLVCRRLGWDFRSEARGGLLHDFFLYDWHVPSPERKRGRHAFLHPAVALSNAEKYFKLNAKEKDVIKKHMWPLTVIPPSCPEAFIVMLEDKYCAYLETRENSRVWLRQGKNILFKRLLSC